MVDPIINTAIVAISVLIGIIYFLQFGVANATGVIKNKKDYIARLMPWFILVLLYNKYKELDNE